MRSIRTLDVSRRAPSEREPLEITHHVGLVRLIPDGGGQLEIGYGSLCVGDRVSKDDRVSFWNRTAAACGGQLILGAGFGSRRLVDHHCDLKPRGNLKRPSESHRWICGVRLRMKTSDARACRGDVRIRPRVNARSFT